ncbi:MAG TPA: hypothetical protein VKA19_04405, partial [Alphaproteobacteria bacterium]|nr:hypothetical protein [Alphaproteobacteria bacterium]
DYLLAARGQAWVRYVPHFGPETRDKIFLQERTEEPTGFSALVGGMSRTTVYADDEGNEVEPAGFENGQAYMEGEPYQPVTYEEVTCDYIAWRDFGHTPAPTWDKVRAVWKTERLTRAQLVERFDDGIGDKVRLTESISGVSEDAAKVFQDVFKRAVVHEIWDSQERKAIWISPGYTEGPLDEQDDPLGLDHFFPCPRPLYGTMTGDTLVPVPDYAEYQDQAYQIDEMTKRISLLVKALKLAGVYNGEMGNQIQGLVEGRENKLIPVDNWAMFAEGGGLKGQMDFLPVAEVATVLSSLVQAREQIKRDLYEVTGMSDIIRGQSDPRETMGAQRIKGNFATLRLQDKQSEMQRFLRDVIRIKAEIIAEHFSPETLEVMTGWLNTPTARALDERHQQAQAAAMQGQQMQGQMAQSPPSANDVFTQAVQLLRDEHLRCFNIDIETDSTVIEDMQQEKQARTEFLAAISSFLSQAVPAAGQYPELARPLTESLMFGIRGFKAGRQLEETWEQAIEDMEKSQTQRQGNDQPSPEAVKAQAEQAKAKADLVQAQLSAQEAERQAQAQVAEDARQAEINAREHQYKMAELAAKHEATMRELALRGAMQGAQNDAQIARQALDEANDKGAAQ